MNGTKPMLMILFGIMSFITLLFLYMGYLHHQYVLDTIVEEEKKIASKIYNNTFKNIAQHYESIATNLLMNKQIIDAFEKKDRSKLLSLTEPIYKHLREENPYLGIMHFHTRDTKSFLRLHKPQKFDDNLSSIRFMINSVNKLKTKQIGFEVGRYGIDYRIALPVFNQDGKHLGAFEFGIQIDYILDIFNKDYGFQNILLLKKDIFEIIYEKNKSVSYKSYSDEYYIMDSNDNNNSLSTKLIEPDNNKIIFTVNTLKDISNKEIGKILFVKDIRFYTEKIVIIRNSSIVSALILLLVSLYLTKRIFTSHMNMMHNYQDKLEMKNNTLLKLVNLDYLTKINNRQSIETILIKELKGVERYDKKLSVIIFDIDDFKNVNDTYGHNIGDIVLKTIANIVSSTIRESDYFGRWGGEEFVVISTESSLEQAAVVAEKIRKNICSYEFKKAGNLSCSIGVAEYNRGDTYQTIVNNADIALYKAKQSGKNRVVLYSSELS